MPPLPPEHLDNPDGVLWVMHCAEGPVPQPSLDALQEFLMRESRPWTLRWEKDFLAIPRQTRELGARVLGARTEDVSLSPTTSTGLVTIAQGLTWKPGDEVLAPLGEFPANAWPWKALEGLGVSFREVPLWEGHQAGRDAWRSTPPPPGASPEERLIAAIGPRTRVITTSWVRFQDGLRLHLPILAKAAAERGIHLVVDGIQGAGTLLPELAGVAAFATGGHKGLLAPQGQGLLWTTPGFRAELRPFGSSLSVEEATNFERPSTDFERPWLDDGIRLEAGVPNLLGCVPFRHSLAWILEAGVDRISAHVASLQMQFLAGLGQLPAWRREAERLSALLDHDRLGAILALHHGDRDQETLQNLLRDGFSRGIFASVREGYLRLAMHGWHCQDDVDRLLAWLAHSRT